MKEQYQRGDFCQSIGCPELNRTRRDCSGCRAFQFQNYLDERGFQVERETDGPCYKKTEAHKKILDYYGEISQIVKAAEEMSELSARLLKFVGYVLRERVVMDDKWEQVRAEIDDEFGDTLNILEQLKMIFPPSAERREYKVTRTLGIIKDQSRGLS